jgi:hypothetical protein
MVGAAGLGSTEEPGDRADIEDALATAEDRLGRIPDTGVNDRADAGWGLAAGRREV